MPWSFIVPAAVGLFSANKQAKAAQGAAAATAAATDEATKLQREMYQQTRADQAPFREGGLEAQNRLMTLLGIGGQTPATGGGGGGGGVAGMEQPFRGGQGGFGRLGGARARKARGARGGAGDTRRGERTAQPDMTRAT